MRKATLLLLLLLFSGCASKETDPGLTLRQSLLEAPGCCFQAEITADYGDTLSRFTLDCNGDAQGGIRFRVTAPESVSGITGTLSAGKGALTFDETLLSFPLLADGELSPISAPWVVLRALRSGYLTSWGQDGTLIYLTINDSFRDDALQVDIWLDELTPIRAEILHKGRKILSINLLDFRTLEENGA